MGEDYGSLVGSEEQEYQKPSHNLQRKQARTVLAVCVVGLMAMVTLSFYSLSDAQVGTEYLLAQGAAQVSLVDVSAMQRAKPTDQVTFEDLSSVRRAEAATTAAQKAPEGPLPVGQVIRVDMPAKEMQSLKVGSVVKGQVRRPMLAADGQEEFNTLDFTGKVCFHSMSIMRSASSLTKNTAYTSPEMSHCIAHIPQVRSLQLITVRGKVQSDAMGEPDEGVVTVKMLSDQFLAPGTAVTVRCVCI